MLVPIPSAHAGISARRGDRELEIAARIAATIMGSVMTACRCIVRVMRRGITNELREPVCVGTEGMEGVRMSNLLSSYTPPEYVPDENPIPHDPTICEVCKAWKLPAHNMPWKQGKVQS